MPTPLTETERDELQMALCRRLAAVAVQLAEAAAAAAIAEYAAGTVVKNGPDHKALFIKFSHAARQAILLEHRIANQRHTPITPPQPREAPAEPAPIRISTPRAPALEYERLDTNLALNPEATPEEILAVLCKTVGLPAEDAIIPAVAQAPPTDPTPFNPWESPEPSLLTRIGLDPTRRT